jgi:hypothetical protein
MPIMLVIHEINYYQSLEYLIRIYTNMAHLARRLNSIKLYFSSFQYFFKVIIV